MAREDVASESSSTNLSGSAPGEGRLATARGERNPRRRPRLRPRVCAGRRPLRGTLTLISRKPFGLKECGSAAFGHEAPLYKDCRNATDARQIVGAARCSWNGENRVSAASPILMASRTWRFLIVSSACSGPILLADQHDLSENVMTQRIAKLKPSKSAYAYAGVFRGPACLPGDGRTLVGTGIHWFKGCMDDTQVLLRRFFRLKSV